MFFPRAFLGKELSALGDAQARPLITFVWFGDPF